MFYPIVRVMLVIVLLLVGVAVVSAQEVTAEPPVLIPLEPVAGVDAVTVWPLIALIALVLVGGFEAIRQRQVGVLLTRYDEALKRKDVQDAAERAYLRSSASIQDIIQLLKSGVTVVGNLDLPVVDTAIDATTGFLNDVTDGQPNT